MSVLRHIFGAHLPEGYWDRALGSLLDRSFDLLKILAVYLLLRWLIVSTVRRLAAPMSALEKDPVQSRRVETLTGLVKSALLYVLAIVALIMALRVLGVDPVPLVTAAGVAGLAIGFGAQKLVRDVISGFFILLENQFAIGETITIAGVTGTVCDVGLRTTRLRDAQGRLFIFPNGDIASVCNHSRGELTVPLEINVAAGTDLDRASDVLDEVAAEVSDQYQLTQAYRSQGISAFDAAKVTLRLAGSVPPAVQEDFLRDLRAAILERLREEGITIV